MNMVDPALIGQLSRLSAERVQNSEEFQRELKTIERYNRLKNEKTVSLNEEKFLAERKELDAEKQEEEQLEKLLNPDEDAIQRDYYMEEALAIAVDYARLAANRRIAQTN